MVNGEADQDIQGPDQIWRGLGQLLERRSAGCSRLVFRSRWTAPTSVPAAALSRPTRLAQRRRTDPLFRRNAGSAAGIRSAPDPACRCDSRRSSTARLVESIARVMSWRLLVQLVGERVELAQELPDLVRPSGQQVVDLGLDHLEVRRYHRRSGWWPELASTRSMVGYADELASGMVSPFFNGSADGSGGAISSTC